MTSVVVGAVDGRRQQQHAVGAVLLGVLGPLFGLVPADTVHTGDDESTVVDRLDGNLDHRRRSSSVSDEYSPSDPFGPTPRHPF